MKSLKVIAIMAAIILSMNACSKLDKLAPTGPDDQDPNENLPTVYFGIKNRVLVEGEVFSKNIILLSEIAQEDVFIHYSCEGTATNNTDYLLSSGNPITISQGSNSAVFTFATITDTIAEGEETMILTLTSASKAQLGEFVELCFTIID